MTAPEGINAYRVLAHSGELLGFVRALCARDAVRGVLGQSGLPLSSVARVEVMGLPPVLWAPVDPAAWGGAA